MDRGSKKSFIEKFPMRFNTLRLPQKGSRNQLRQAPGMKIEPNENWCTTLKNGAPKPLCPAVAHEGVGGID